MNKKNHIAWEEQLINLIEDHDVCRSDAQGIVEANQGLVDNMFAQNKLPQDVATVLMQG